MQLSLREKGCSPTGERGRYVPSRNDCDCHDQAAHAAHLGQPCTDPRIRHLRSARHLRIQLKTQSQCSSPCWVAGFACNTVQQHHSDRVLPIAIPLHVSTVYACT